MKTREQLEAEETARYKGFHKGMIKRFADMGFEVEDVVAAFQHGRSDIDCFSLTLFRSYTLFSMLLGSLRWRSLSPRNGDTKSRSSSNVRYERPAIPHAGYLTVCYVSSSVCEANACSR